MRYVCLWKGFSEQPASEPLAEPAQPETEILQNLVGELDVEQLRQAHDRLAAERLSGTVPSDTIKHLSIALRDIGLLKNVLQPETLLADRARHNYLSLTELQEFGQAVGDAELVAMLTELTREVGRRRAPAA